VTDPEHGTIVVRRPRGIWRYILRRYEVEVDGVVRGSVARDAQIEIELPAGPHDVRAAIDWSGSPVLPVEVKPGRPVTLQVEPAGNAVMGFLQMWRRDTYLTLELVDTV
jgi:hypothetical protein